MGKQTAVALTASDEKQFLDFLQSIAEIKLLLSSGPTIESLWVDSFEAKNGYAKFYIWNTAFPWKPKYGTVTADPSGARNGYRYIEDSETAPVIEYSRHNFHDPRAYGRVYWSKSFAAPDGLDYDVLLFDKWYSAVVRWLRRNGRQATKGSTNAYYLPDAWVRYGQGI